MGARIINRRLANLNRADIRAAGASLGARIRPSRAERVPRDEVQELFRDWWRHGADDESLLSAEDASREFTEAFYRGQNSGRRPNARRRFRTSSDPYQIEHERKLERWAELSSRGYGYLTDDEQEELLRLEGYFGAGPGSHRGPEAHSNPDVLRLDRGRIMVTLPSGTPMDEAQQIAEEAIGPARMYRMEFDDVTDSTRYVFEKR